jgi:hypothetical protein
MPSKDMAPVLLRVYCVCQSSVRFRLLNTGVRRHDLVACHLMYMCVCVCVSVCVYIYIYTHTHTHTYILLQRKKIRLYKKAFLRLKGIEFREREIETEVCGDHNLS